MLNQTSDLLSEFFRINSQAFIESLDAREKDIVATEIGFTPDERYFSDLNDPTVAFKLLISTGYPEFRNHIDLSSLELLIDSEYECTILELFCKVNFDLPESLKNRGKIKIYACLEDCNWENLNPDDFIDWKCEEYYKHLSLLFTFFIKFYPNEREDFIKNPNFKPFLLWLIQEKNDSLLLELYLLIMNILLESHTELLLNCWIPYDTKIIHSVISKINSRQALLNFLTLLTKYESSPAIDQEADDYFFNKIWDFIYDKDNENDQELFLQICSKSGKFTVDCFNLFIKYFRQNEKNFAERMISLIDIYQELMLSVKISTSAEVSNFHEIVESLYTYSTSAQYALLDLVDSQLKSQLYLKDFLQCYFELLGNQISEESAIETNIRQFVVYTLCSDDNSLRKKKEVMLQNYLFNLFQFFKRTKLTLDDFSKYSKLIEDIYHFIPSLYAPILELAQKEFDLFKSNNSVYSEMNPFYILLSYFAEPVNIYTDSIIPQEIIEIINIVIDYLGTDRGSEIKINLNNSIIPFQDPDMEHYNYNAISYEEITSDGKLNYWVKSILLNKGIPNILDSVLSDDDAIFMKDILEKALKSISFQTIFNPNIKYPIRLYFASHFTRLVSLAIKKGVHDNILKIANMNAAQMIGRPCKPISPEDKLFLTLIVNSEVAKEAFNKYGYDIIKAVGFENKTFYAYLPLKVNGVAVLGGAILLNSVTEQKTSFYKCIKIIAYLRELAHALKKYKSGLYDLENCTPENEYDDVYEGYPMTKMCDDALILNSTTEGGMQIEAILFGNFENKLNDNQISFIANRMSWKTNLNKFQQKLSEFNSCTSTYYHHGREYYSIDREPHINFSFLKKK